jgi:pre-mRNA cleavage complex 2 protein Pcf11
MRKAMEGLLRTWKQPVPESMDPRPVFPPEVTGDIENALNKMRSAIQQAPVNRPMHALPPRPATNVAWRNNTSTPPQHGNMYAAPQDPRVQQVTSQPKHRERDTDTRRQTFQSGPQCGNFPAGQAPYGTPQSFPSLMSSNDLEDLKTEVGKLIANSQQAFAYNPADTSLQTKLQALLQLKKVLDTQTLPPQQLEAVRMQVRNLAPPPAPTPMPTFAPPVSFPPPMIHSPHPTPTPSFPPPASTPQLNLAQLLANMRPPAPQVTTAPPPSTPNLADLLRHVSSAQSSTPPVAAFFPPSYPNPSTFSTPVQAPAVPASAPSAPPNLAQILAQFSKPAGAPSVPAMQHAQPPMNHMTQFQSQPPAGLPMQGSADWLLNALKGFPNPGTPSNSTPLPSQPMTRQISAPKNAPNEIELTTASMKM